MILYEENPLKIDQWSESDNINSIKDFYSYVLGVYAISVVDVIVKIWCRLKVNINYVQENQNIGSNVHFYINW